MELRSGLWLHTVQPFFLRDGRDHSFFSMHLKMRKSAVAKKAGIAPHPVNQGLRTRMKYVMWVQFSWESSSEGLGSCGSTVTHTGMRLHAADITVHGVRMRATGQAKWSAVKAGWATGMAVTALIAGCGGKSELLVLPPQESFTSAATFSRMFDARADQTCEAARRALLSQGYIIDTSRNDLVEGNKNFQPDPERHLKMNIRVVCAPESGDGKLSVGFVTAVQDSFALRKASNSASVGVSALGSLSLPFSAGHDSMIKVGSETIQSERFYESFFELMRRYLQVDTVHVQTSDQRAVEKP